MVSTVQGSTSPVGVDWRSTQGLHADKAEGGRRVGQADQRAEANASIMQVSMQVSITAKNETMRLLLQSVMTNLNESIKPYLESAVGTAESGQAPAAQAAAPADPAATAGGVDYSPEATAQRIFQFATGFFEAFKQQHGDMGDEATVNHFLDVIKSGIDQGFKEAREILKGLGVLQGDIAANVDKTYELIQTKLGDWQKQMLDSLKGGQPSAQAESSAIKTG
jgi:hypothetical protein